MRAVLYIAMRGGTPVTASDERGSIQRMVNDRREIEIKSGKEPTWSIAMVPACITEGEPNARAKR